MGWRIIKDTLWKIELVLLPIRASFLLCALFLGALAGGGLRTFLTTSMPSVRELPRWKSETLRLSGQHETPTSGSVPWNERMTRSNEAEGSR